jgi:hypothetical protein
MARGKISLAHAIHWRPSTFLFFTRPESLYFEERAYTHISVCVEIVYELPLLLNSTPSETLLQESGEVRFVDWIFITGTLNWL